MVSVVRSAGWEAAPSGGATLLAAGERRPLAPADRHAEQEVVRTVFAGTVARERARRLLGVIEDFQPGVIVRDEVDFGAAVAAEASQLPHAAVVVIAAGGFLELIPAREILPRCELVISHGGSGTVIGALAFGVPQILLPIGADQPLNAERCRALGVAAVLDASTVTEHAISQAARAVLEDRTYRTAASRVRDEIRSLPRAARAAEQLERLAEKAAP